MYWVVKSVLVFVVVVVVAFRGLGFYSEHLPDVAFVLLVIFSIMFIWTLLVYLKERTKKWLIATVSLATDTFFIAILWYLFFVAAV